MQSKLDNLRCSMCVRNAATTIVRLSGRLPLALCNRCTTDYPLLRNTFTSISVLEIVNDRQQNPDKFPWRPEDLAERAW
jgi:hypothetical protein